MGLQKEMIEMCKELRLPSIRSLLEQEALFEQHIADLLSLFRFKTGNGGPLRVSKS